MKLFTIFFTVAVLITAHSCRRSGIELLLERIEHDKATGPAIKDEAEDNKSQGKIPVEKEVEDEEEGRVIYPTEKAPVSYTTEKAPVPYITTEKAPVPYITTEKAPVPYTTKKAQVPYTTEKATVPYTTEKTQLTHSAKAPEVLRRIAIPRMRNLTIPESVLIEMSDIRSADEFLRRFVQMDSKDDIETTGKRERQSVLGRKSLSGETFIQVSEFARCEPQRQVVKLENSEVGLLFWPSCVHLPRCGGCCTSEQLMCRPTVTSTVNITVLQMRYTGAQSGPFANEGMKTMPMEQHDSCACGCKELPEHCTFSQEYRQKECRCVCTNQEEATICQKRAEKFWDGRDCVCKCRNTVKCSSGLYFSYNTCRCEILRISFVSRIGVPLPDSNQAKEAHNETENFKSRQNDDK